MAEIRSHFLSRSRTDIKRFSKRTAARIAVLDRDLGKSGTSTTDLLALALLGSRGVFGSLSSPGLREFLNRLAGGWVSTLSVLVTSRFPLSELRDARPQFFHAIPIEEIELMTGVQLLRDRGIRGNDAQLIPIVELTVDLAGGYIKE